MSVLAIDEKSAPRIDDRPVLMIDAVGEDGG